MIVKNSICHPLFFFLLTFAYSWAFWIGAILVGGLIELTGTVLLLLGGTGPMVCGFILNRVCYKDSKMLVVRMFDPRRLTRLSLLGIAVVTLLPASIAIMYGGIIQNTWVSIQNGASFILSSSMLFSTLAFNLIAVLAEEPGWRGYVLDKLQARWSALFSSIILSFFWALWHLPLFIIPGSYQSGLGIGTFGFWMYMGAIPATTILITWVYNNTYRSVLSAILLHLINNLIGEIFSFDILLESVRIILSYSLVVVVVYKYGYTKLTRTSYETKEFVDYSSPVSEE